jgi:hypothetical protein
VEGKGLLGVAQGFLEVALAAAAADHRRAEHTHAPQLLQRHGVGPDSAAALLITADDNPDRMSGEASFAALCGSARSKPRRAKRAGAGSTGAATGAPTPPSTAAPTPPSTAAPTPPSTAAPTPPSTASR